MFSKAFKKKRDDIEDARDKVDGAAAGSKLAFEDQDIQVQMDRADVDHDGKLDAAEKKDFQRRLNGMEKGLDADRAAVARNLPSSVPMGGANSVDVAKINKRVDRLEQAMGSTIAKIDAILVHLENIEFAQRVAAGFEDDAGPEAEA